MKLFKLIICNKINFLVLIVSLIIWASVGVKLDLNHNISENFINSKLLNNFRYLMPFILLVILNFIKKENSNYKVIKYLFIFIFISNLIGYFNFYYINNNYVDILFDDQLLINSGYLPDKNKDLFFCFYFLVTFFLFSKFKEKEIKNSLITNYIIIITLSLITIYFSYSEYFGSNKKYLYYTNFLVEGELLGVDTMRSLGLARNILIISIPLMLYCFFSRNKDITKYLLLVILIFFLTNLIQTQSRASLYIFYIYIFIFFILKIVKKKYKDIILISFVALIIPQLISDSIPKFKSFFLNTEIENRKKSRIFTFDPNLTNNTNIIGVKNYNSNNKNLNDKNLNDKNHNYDIIYNTVDTFSSGRTNLWNKTINIFFNEKKIKYKSMGFGPTSERYLIKESISNALLYSLLSGGILGILGLLMLYIFIIFEILKFFLIKINISEEIFGYSSIFIILFLLLRSLVENSFLIFGTDHIVFILCILYLKNINLMNQK